VLTDAAQQGRRQWTYLAAQAAHALRNASDLAHWKETAASNAPLVPPAGARDAAIAVLSPCDEGSTDPPSRQRARQAHSAGHTAPPASLATSGHRPSNASATLQRACRRCQRQAPCSGELQARGRLRPTRCAAGSEVPCAPTQVAAPQPETLCPHAAIHAPHMRAAHAKSSSAWDAVHISPEDTGDWDTEIV